MALEVLHVADCPNLAPLLERLREATDLPVTTREISTDVAATAAGMNGSPTLLVNGRDPFPNPNLQDCDCGLTCRIYRDEHGRAVPAPSVGQLRAAVGASRDEPCCDPVRPGDALSAWRARALPLHPVEKAVHQAVLRAFAATGRPPTISALNAVTAGSRRATGDVLAALHELDAVRLGPDGRVAVAYPFSATPTRHRVRIGDRLEVYAMCALDALGMSAMLGEDTRIDSVDVTTGHPVTVFMTAGTTRGVTRWAPAEAVVFVGADAAGGSSADCCCGYLNFFTDAATARAWTATHPQVPGQILTQAEAEDLGVRLFGNLLTPAEPTRSPTLPQPPVGSNAGPSRRPPSSASPPACIWYLGTDLAWALGSIGGPDGRRVQ
ncbi:alkylmercury lyase [Pseudonocardia sp. MH-G8]|nr:alkylmercury lyase [Pseudonocardia sp. MH-G8]